MLKPRVLVWLAAFAWPALAAQPSACSGEAGESPFRPGRVPAELIGHPADPGGIQALEARIAQNGQAFLDKLDDLDPFHGLYLRWQHERRLDDGQGASSYALEWEAFNDGRDQAVKRLDKARLEHQVQYLQLLRDMRERAFQERRFHLQSTRNRLMAHLYGQEVAALETLRERRMREMMAGVVTRDEVAEIEFKLRRARLQLDYYAGARQLPVRPTDAGLLDQASRLDLLSRDELLRRAVAQSHEYQLQTLFADRSDQFPTWTDDLSLRLYLEHRQGFEQDSDNVLGVRLRVPLQGDGERKEMVALERGLYLDQQRAVEGRLGQKIDALLDAIRVRQQALRVMEEELILMDERRRLACRLASRPISVIDATPERTLDNLATQVHEKTRDMYTLRFEILDALLELDAMTQPERLADLLKPAPAEGRR